MRKYSATVLAAVLVAALTGSVAADAATSHRPVITSMSSHGGTTTGGSLVTVHGRQIGRHLLVSFLGRSIGYHRVSASEIVVRAPATSMPTSGWLRVHTTVGGTSAHSAASAYAYRWPAPQITSLSTHLGSTYGGNVVVHGRYLWDVRSVTFGGVQSPQFYGQDTTLYVRLPYHGAATTTVTVTTATGSSRAAGATTRFEFFPPPTVSSLSPAAGSTAGGTTMTVNGTGLRAPVSVRFGSFSATNVHVASASSATVTVPAHDSGVVPVTVATPIGTSQATTYRYGPSVPQQWSAPQTVDTVNSIRQLACAGSDFCMATDSNNRYLTRGANGWSAVSSGTAGSRTLSCPSTTFCMAISLSAVWTWDGTSWTRSDTPAPFSVVTMSCTSPSFCEATSGSKASTWDGTQWSAPGPAIRDGVSAISCWADGSCVASDSYGYLSALQGGTWSGDGHLGVFGHGTVTTLRCRAADACTAGTTAGAVVTPAGAVDDVLSEKIAWLTCTSDTSCLAAGPSSTATLDGTSWGAPVEAPAPITAVSCPAGHSCVVASDHDVRTLTW